MTIVGAYRMNAVLRAARRRTADDGASAVEFALVAPLLFLLVFGIISFGLYFASALSLSNSARQGARSAVVQDSTCADAATQVADSVGSTIGLKYPVTVTVKLNSATKCVASVSSGGGVTYSTGSATTSPCAGSSSGDRVTVIARGATSLFVPGWLINNSFGVGGQGVYRCEFS